MKKTRILSAMLAVLFIIPAMGCNSSNNVNEGKTSQTNTNNVTNEYEADENNDTANDIKTENDIIGKWYKVSRMVVGGKEYRGPDDPNMVTCLFYNDQRLSFNTDYDDDTFRFLKSEFSTYVTGSWGSPTTDENGDFVYPLYCDGNQFGSATLNSEPEGGLTITLFWQNDILYFDSYDCKISDE